mmetsp:Transcript_14153/g.28862  ORF Transcript_14153/g.28862 Transcript_14153/m.28862 type:complete len:654 (-) Transcript_14153:124-2085(-)
MVNARHCKNDIADVDPQLHFPRVAVISTVCGVISFVFGCGVRIVNLPRDKGKLPIQPDRLENMHQVPLQGLRVLNLTDESANYTSLSESWFVFDASDRDEDDESAAGIGNQLLVDIKNVNSNFLNSEERLKKAMIALLAENDFEPVSYYCRSRNHAGYSCHGHFDEAVMNLYTFPFNGVISLDLLTRDEEDLISFLEKIEGVFAIPEEKIHQLDEDYPPPQMTWTHKLRNFRHEFGVEDYHEGGKSVVEGELTQDILSQPGFEMKKQVAFVETKYQNVHFYEAINTHFRSVASYEKSLSKDGSYESLHPELFRQDKIVFLDGDSQSSLYGEAVYHEGLVHAAMLTHPNPKRVAIIGGGEGATLREVLKHKTVQEVVMIDIDGEFVQLCRKYLPEWSDCSDLVGSTAPSCFDDDRARVYFEDAFQWFIDRFAAGKRHADPEEDFFDVIIMDACDPTNDFVTKLYVDSTFVKSLYNGLSKSGVFIAQIGRAAAAVVDETAMFKRMFSDVGFRSMHIYDEGRSGFYEPWSHLVALKNTVSRKLWYQNAANIDIELHKRIVSTHSGEPALLYFDASVMLSYQLPHMVHEDVYCRLHLQQCYAVEDMVKNRDLDLTVIDDGDPFNPLYERNVFYNKPNATVFSILAENGVAKFISLVP